MKANEIVNIAGLKDAYLVANTASFLYNSFVQDESIFDLRNTFKQQYLIDEFSAIANREIANIDELIIAYALYIAILQFNNELTIAFLNENGNIKFDWFPELRSLYLARAKPENFIELQTKDFTISPKGYSNNKDITLNEFEIQLT